MQRSFDLDGRITQFPVSQSESGTILYDAGGRISEMGRSPLNFSLTEQFYYDNRNRMQRYVNSATTPAVRLRRERQPDQPADRGPA